MGELSAVNRFFLPRKRYPFLAALVGGYGYGVSGNLKESFSWPLENVSSSADLFSS